MRVGDTSFIPPSGDAGKNPHYREISALKEYIDSIRDDWIKKAEAASPVGGQQLRAALTRLYAEFDKYPRPSMPKQAFDAVAAHVMQEVRMNAATRPVFLEGMKETWDGTA